MRPWLAILAICLILVMAIAFLSTVMSSGTATPSPTSPDGNPESSPAIAAAQGEAPPAATLAAMPSQVTSTQPIQIKGSYAFEGVAMAYAWSSVFLAFDAATYRFDATGADAACQASWSFADATHRDGFAIDVSPRSQTTLSRTYAPAVTSGTLMVTSTCPSWSLTVSEGAPTS